MAGSVVGAVSRWPGLPALECFRRDLEGGFKPTEMFVRGALWLRAVSVAASATCCLVVVWDGHFRS